MMKHPLLLVPVVGLYWGVGQSQNFLDELFIEPNSDPVDQWYPSSHDQIKTAIESSSSTMRDLLSQAERHLVILVEEEGSSCADPTTGAQERACVASENIQAYSRFIDADQACWIGGVLQLVDRPDVPAMSIKLDADEAVRSGANSIRSLDLFTPPIVPVSESFPLFNTGIKEQCTGTGSLQFTPIEIPSTSTSALDKYILAYSYGLSLVTWKYNLPNVQVTSEQIRLANERWTNFETNVIQDQYPWETLIFNDWLAGSSSRFRGDSNASA